MKIYYNTKKYKFISTSMLDGPPGYHERNNEPITILYQIKDDVDSEIGKMYRVVFDDGVMMDAFEDEVEVWKTKK